jgi:hypothetical protein
MPFIEKLTKWQVERVEHSRDYEEQVAGEQVAGTGKRLFWFGS